MTVDWRDIFHLHRHTVPAPTVYAELLASYNGGQTHMLDLCQTVEVAHIKDGTLELHETKEEELQEAQWQN